jgi:hypothetical protein
MILLFIESSIETLALRNAPASSSDYANGVDVTVKKTGCLHARNAEAIFLPIFDQKKP